MDPARTVSDLEEIRRLTGDDDGAQRVAWTDTWTTARDWIREQLEAIDRLSLERKQAPTMAIWRDALDEISGAKGR